MSKTLTKNYTVYRDAKTGQFIPAKVAKRRPATTKRERISVKPKTSSQSAKTIKFVNKKYSRALTGLAKR